MNTLIRHKSPLALPCINPHSRISFKKHNRARVVLPRQSRKSRNLGRRMKRLRSEMEEISKEQRKIKEGQRQVREKFLAVEIECEQLRQETNMIMQQSRNTQIRLALMFQILKARENHDFNTAAQLTSVLRELIAGENQQKT